MAVAPTGAIYKSLSFDGENSRNYGVYITGEAVYNAPERDVEMITIPGRNGSFALDNGRFQNIEVSYPAGIFADTEADFRQAISGFRNFLCSRKGYVRLSDEYNPDEYRMAVYKSGLEVDPAMLKAGEFKITFDCKPQRWLTSGESAATIANSGDTITNPTLFDSSPLLEIDGYGTIGFNGYTVELENAVMGEVVIDSGGTRAPGVTPQLIIKFSPAQFNNGDAITVPPTTLTMPEVRCNSTMASYPMSSPDLMTLSLTSDSLTGASTTITKMEDNKFIVSTAFPQITFYVGTAATYTNVTTTSGTYKYYDYSDHAEHTVSFSGDTAIQSTIRYNGSNLLIIRIEVVFAVNEPLDDGSSLHFQYAIPRITGDSTLSLLGNPTYIDCDLGEAYLINGTTPVSLNAYIDLGSDLPKLVSGANSITYDNTITSLKVTPKWWKV